MKKNPSRRSYDATLRAEQAELTAARILAAVARRFQMGDRQLSYARIAKEAGVSTPTVYRHFPTPQDMHRAFARAEAERDSETLDLARLREQLRVFFARQEDPDDVLSAGRVSEIWEFSRVGSVPRRRAQLQDALDREAPGLPAADRDAIVDLCTVLISSASGEAFRGYLELSSDQVTDRVAYAVELMFHHARRLARQHAETPEDPP